MVECYGFDITRVDVDFGLYLANEERIDELALKSGKHYFIGHEVIDEFREVAVFLFPGRQPALRFTDQVAELRALD